MITDIWKSIRAALEARHQAILEAEAMVANHDHVALRQAMDWAADPHLPYDERLHFERIVVIALRSRREPTFRRPEDQGHDHRAVVLATRVEGAVLKAMVRSRNHRGLTTVALLVALAAGAPPAASRPDTFAGSVTRVVDGDTFWLDSRDVSIRVWGLDAPERGQPGGAEATAVLTRMIAGEQLIAASAT